MKPIPYPVAQSDLICAVQIISRFQFPLTVEGAEKCERVIRAGLDKQDTPFWTDPVYLRHTISRAQWIVRIVRQDRIGPRSGEFYENLGTEVPTFTLEMPPGGSPDERVVITAPVV
jgi:hypothetical protein